MVGVLPSAATSSTRTSSSTSAPSSRGSSSSAARRRRAEAGFRPTATGSRRRSFDGRKTDDAEDQDGEKWGTIADVDRAARSVDVKKTQARQDEHPRVAFAHKHVPSNAIPTALMGLAATIIDHGVEAATAERGPRDSSSPIPRASRGRASRQAHGERLVEFAIRAVLALDRSRPPDPGPARRRQDLHRRAHDLSSCVRRGHEGRRHRRQPQGHPQPPRRGPSKPRKEEGVPLQCVHKAPRSRRAVADGIDEVTTTRRLRRPRDGAAQVVAGTVWPWSRATPRTPSTSSSSTKPARSRSPTSSPLRRPRSSVVLLGDPQQLEQPQGHPPRRRRRLRPRAPARRPARPCPTTAASSSTRPGASTPRSAPSRPSSSTTAASNRAPSWSSRLSGAPPLRRRRPLVRARRARRQHELLARGGRRPSRLVVESSSPGSRLDQRQGRDASPSPPPTSSSSRPTTPRSPPPATRSPLGHPRRHRRPLPGAGGAGRHLLHGDVAAGRRAARDGVPLQPEPPERRDLAGAVRLHPRREPAPARAGLPDAAADAAGERAVPVCRAM